MTTQDVPSAADRQSTGLAAIAALLLLVVTGVWITRELVVADMLQMCLVTGSHHCEQRLPALRHMLPTRWD